MSRMTAIALFALVAAPAGAQPVTAEQALDTYRESFPSPRQLDCPNGKPDEIVVCARPKGAPDPNRLPLPVAREPGAGVPGDLPSAMSAMKADACQPFERCGSGGFSISVDLTKIPGFIGKVAERLKDD